MVLVHKEIDAVPIEIRAVHARIKSRMSEIRRIIKGPTPQFTITHSNPHRIIISGDGCKEHLTALGSQQIRMQMLPAL